MPAARFTAIAAGTAVAAVLVLAPQASAQPGPAPGGPGAPASWTDADKHGFGTSRTPQSEVWFTLRPGELSEVYYPDLGTPALRDLEFVVTDGTTAEHTAATAGATKAPDARVPAYEQTDTSPSGGWKLTRRYVTDPARSTVLIDVSFSSLDGRPYQVYAVADPGLSNGGNDDTAAVVGPDLVASDGGAAMALSSDGPLADPSVGYAGSSDGRTDLLADGKQGTTYTEAGPGNVVLSARLDGVTGIGGDQGGVLALGFGADRATATAAAHDSLAAGFDAAAGAYADGWHRYLDGL